MVVSQEAQKGFAETPARIGDQMRRLSMTLLGCDSVWKERERAREKFF
jgi:hypothetical protein